MISGYSIPVKDATANPIDVDKEDGVYLGHVTTVTNSQGIIYAVYPKWHGIGQVVMKKSEDGGKTWSERLSVPESWTWSFNVPILYKLKDAAGKERLMMFTSSHYPLYRSISEDDGATWTEFTDAGMPDLGSYGFMGMTELGPGHYLTLFQEGGKGRPAGYDNAQVMGIILAAGEGTDRRTINIQMERNSQGEWVDNGAFEFGVEQPPLKPGERWRVVKTYFQSPKYKDGRHEIWQAETFDGGMTWGNVRCIASTTEYWLCEPEVVVSPDGQELLMLMRESSREKNCVIMRSRDKGKTWTEPQELSHGALTGDRHTAKYLKDGRLMVVFRDMNVHSITNGHFVGWIGTYEDIVSGREGEMRLLLGRSKKQSDCAYPGLEILEDGTAVATTYGRWISAKEPPFIRCFRIHPDDIAALPTVEA